MFYRVNFSIPQDVLGKDGFITSKTYGRVDGSTVRTGTINEAASDSTEPGWNCIDTGRTYETYKSAQDVVERLIKYHPFIQSAAIMHNHPDCSGILCWEEKNTDPEAFKQHKETNKKYGHPELDNWEDGWYIESCGCMGASPNHESDCEGNEWGPKTLKSVKEKWKDRLCYFCCQLMNK